MALTRILCPKKSEIEWDCDKLCKKYLNANANDSHGLGIIFSTAAGVGWTQSG